MNGWRGTGCGGSGCWIAGAPTNAGGGFESGPSGIGMAAAAGAASASAASAIDPAVRPIPGPLLGGNVVRGRVAAAAEPSGAGPEAPAAEAPGQGPQQRRGEQ